MGKKFNKCKYKNPKTNKCILHKQYFNKSILCIKPEFCKYYSIKIFERKFL